MQFKELDERYDLTDRARLKAVGNALLTSSQVGATQAIWTLLELSFYRISRDVMSVHAYDRST